METENGWQVQERNTANALHNKTEVDLDLRGGPE